MKTETKDLEKRVDLSAAHYLKKHEHVILENTWECDFGVVDLVTMDNGCLCFVEINRVNLPKDFELPSVVTDEKRGKYEAIACQYLIDHPRIKDIPMRFDIVDVCPLDDDRCMIKHHVNAFGVA